jgi:hypothetical protein
MQNAAEGGRDSNLLRHFRNHVWRQLAQVEDESSAESLSQTSQNFGVDAVENAARDFPPVGVKFSFSHNVSWDG